jgi:V/A-type H+/Na+-transporting ATPase subunit I
MRWRDALEPARMQRVAVVSRTVRLGHVLAALGDAGVVELERVGATAPMEEVEATAVRREEVSGFVGWSPVAAVDALAARLAPLGATVVRLRAPRWAQPPTLISAGGLTRDFQPLVDTYATLPYADVNPAAVAGVAYVVMFGMMFADVAHGALVAACGVLLASGRPARWSGFRRFAPFVIGAGLSSMAFGFAFGELFGPTHVVPALWIAPLHHATTVLAVAIAAGAALLAIAYALGSANRWREGGLARALLATSGLAGASVYLGIAGVGLGWYYHAVLAEAAGAVLAVFGLGFGFAGCYAETGGVPQAAVELFDSVVRIGTNTVSFARLAAFGLTHAALSQVVWSGTVGLWHRGPALWVASAAVFLVGNAIALALEGLVAGIQALRLEYYELFSRVFVDEGRRFHPWHLPTPPFELHPPTSPASPKKEVSCSPG